MEPPETPAAPTSREAVEREILDAFHTPVRRPRPSLFYQAGLAIVAVTMVLLPLIYIGLICLVAYGVYYHAVHDLSILTKGSGGKARIVAYATPIVAGCMVIFFMVKPFLARRPAPRPARGLPREAEPFFHTFVERIAALVGAPRPSAISIDTRVNASAGPRRGFLSILKRDLVLTVGTPLIAGLSLRSLAGVIAHELGHFSQGFGMGFTYTIRSVNEWFARVVYERDSWDAWLTDKSKEGGWGSIVFAVARFFVWLTRKILWALLHAGHAMSCLMMRQMEYDADRREAIVGGSETFGATARRLEVLAVASRGAYADLQRLWRERELPDDLARCIIANVAQIPASIHAEIEADFERGKTRAFDTHPSNRDRIASVGRLRAPGIFASDMPATVLFRDFPSLSKAASEDEYRLNLESDFDPAALRPAAELLARLEAEDAVRNGSRRYFQDTLNARRPVVLSESSLTAPREPRQTVEEIKGARERILAESATYRRACEAYEEADNRIMVLAGAEACFEAKIPISPKDFGLERSGPDAVREKRDEIAREQQALTPTLAPFEAAVAARLAGALRLLLHVPALEKKIADGTKLKATAADLLAAAGVLVPCIPELLELRRRSHGTNVLIDVLDEVPDRDEVLGIVRSRLAQESQALGRLRERLGRDVLYPFAHGSGPISVGDYLLPSFPADGDHDGTRAATSRLLDRAFTLYFELYGHLARVAEHVEKRLGLAPFPAPPEE